MDSLFDNKTSYGAGPDLTGGFGATSAGQPVGSPSLPHPVASNDPKKKPYGELGTVGEARATPTAATALGEGARRTRGNAIGGGMKFATFATGNLETVVNIATAFGRVSQRRARICVPTLRTSPGRHGSVP
jgi:hypothetical protein